MKKIVGLGANVFDTLINCENFPLEDTKQKASGIFVAGGGPVGNALVVISKLGIKAQVIGAIADDSAGDYLLSDFNKYGVDTQYLTRVFNTSSFTSYIILSETNGSRTCVFDRGTVPDVVDNVNLCALKDAFVLHLDGNYINSAIFAAKKAKELGVKVSLDAGGLYQGVDQLLPYVDILIPSAEFAMGFTKKDNILDAMKVLSEKYSPEVLVVTDGANGGYYSANEEFLRYDSIKVKAVDTNGAGDTFHGAFLVAYAKGKTIKECCEFASKVAAYKCTQKGARTYRLDEEVLQSFNK